MSSRKPRAVQLAALKESRGKRGFGFLMEQGLGKTGTALMEMSEEYAAETIGCAVTICPNTFKEGWRQEVKDWGFPISSYVYDSASPPYIRRKNEGLQNLIINVEAVRSDNAKRFIKEFINGRKFYLAFDESVMLSTYNSSQTKAAIELSKEADRRRILSGRWIRNAPDDAWAQLRFIGALDGFMYHPFRYKYCKMGGFKGKIAEGFKEGMEEPFAKLVKPWVFQAIKKNWGLDIGRSYSVRNYKLTPEMQRHFDMMMHEFMVEWQDEIVSIDVAIAKYEKLSQIQCGYIIREDGSVLELVEPSKNPRLNAFRHFRDTEVATKVCIPYHHRYAGKLLKDAFPGAAVISGGLSPAETSEQKLRFNNDPECREILLQTRAAKYGHTLLGDQDNHINSCSTMAFFENTYSMDDRSQIEDRIHRDGQRAEACSYVDFVGTTIDNRMVEALARRQNVWDTFLSAMNAGP